MATATITLKKGTTAEWTESKRVLDDGELGLETTTSGHRIIRIGNGSTEFMSLPGAVPCRGAHEHLRQLQRGERHTHTHTHIHMHFNVTQKSHRTEG